MSAKHYHFFVVGRGRFPLDMLRYDACYPNAADDAGRMGNECNRRMVELVHVGDRCWGGPTHDRWNSFGWLVLRGADEVVEWLERIAEEGRAHNAKAIVRAAGEAE